MALRGELVKVSAFFLKNWRMTYRNVFTVFEVVFWPVVSLLTVGLMTRFLDLNPQTTVFVLVGTLALSTVQVCQLDVAYAVLFDMWAKSIKHQLVAPVHPWHLAAGAWLMGLARGSTVFLLMALACRLVFDVDIAAAGVVGTGAFVSGLLISAAAVGLVVATLLLRFGLRAEVSAWSGVSVLLLLCGIYYPVSTLPGPLAAVAWGIPITYLLEGFRAHFGVTPAIEAPLAWGLAMALLYLALAYLLFTRALARSRRTGMLLRLSD
jgi:ABC-2 type transport system permease protein